MTPHPVPRLLEARALVGEWGLFQERGVREETPEVGVAQAVASCSQMSGWQRWRQRGGAGVFSSASTLSPETGLRLPRWGGR